MARTPAALRSFSVGLEPQLGAAMSAAAGFSDPRDDGRSQTYDRQGHLPDGWKCKVDQNKRRVFYYNRARNVTCVPNQHSRVMVVGAVANGAVRAGPGTGRTRGTRGAARPPGPRPRAGRGQARAARSPGRAISPERA